MSWLTISNISLAQPFYSELNALFFHSTIIGKIYLAQISKIKAKYNINAWWSWLLGQVQANKKLDKDKTSLLFMSSLTAPTNANLYFILHPESETKILLAPKVSNSFWQFMHPSGTDDLQSLNKTQLLYYVNRVTGVYCLCSLLSIVPNILAIVYKHRYPGFSHCYKIITRFWLIKNWKSCFVFAFITSFNV